MFKQPPKTVDQIDRDIVELHKRYERAMDEAHFEMADIYERDIDKLLELRHAVTNVVAFS